MKSYHIIYADHDDMLFEKKNRAYGAYFLRKRYVKNLFTAVAIVGMAFISVSVGPRIAQLLGAQDMETDVVKTMVVKVNMSELPPPPKLDDADKPPPPPPPKAPPPKVRTVAFKIPEPTPEEELPADADNTIAEVVELKEAPKIGLDDQEGSDEVFFDGEIDVVEDVPEVISKPPVIEPDVDEFIMVQEEPRPINMEEVQGLMGYPTFARDAGIEGSVVLRILVDEEGKYVRHKVINQVHPALTEVCEENIPKLRFTPAIQNNQPIKFWVIFRLNSHYSTNRISILV